MSGEGRRRFDHDARNIAIDHVHDELHRGHAFHIDHDTGDIADGTETDLLIKVGANTMHFGPSIETTGAFLLDLHEGVAVSADGSAKSAYNKRRESGSTPSGSFFSGPTVSDTGTRIDRALAPGSKKSGGALEKTGQGEWDLEPNTNYLVRATNVSGGQARAVIELNWYEPGL